MASQLVIDGLVGVIKDCLTDKINNNFDKNSSLTVDIARIVVSEIEDKCNNYTDIEISKIEDMIGDPNIDISHLTRFMNQIYDLLDGDELVSGLQIFDLLLEDSSEAKVTIAEHGVTLQGIANDLGDLQTSLVDHSNRLDILEGYNREVLDCIECQDGFLDILKDATSVACSNTSDSLSSYRANESEDLFDDFANEMDPISCEASFSENEDGDVKVDCDYEGRRVTRMKCSLSRSVGDPFEIDMDLDKGKSSCVSNLKPNELSGPVKISCFNKNNKNLIDFDFFYTRG